MNSEEIRERHNEILDRMRDAAETMRSFTANEDEQREAEGVYTHCELDLSDLHERCEQETGHEGRKPTRMFPCDICGAPFTEPA